MLNERIALRLRDRGALTKITHWGVLVSWPEHIKCAT